MPFTRHFGALCMGTTTLSLIFAVPRIPQTISFLTMTSPFPIKYLGVEQAEQQRESASPSTREGPEASDRPSLHSVITIADTRLLSTTFAIERPFAGEADV